MYVAIEIGEYQLYFLEKSSGAKDRLLHLRYGRKGGRLLRSALCHHGKLHGATAHLVEAWKQMGIHGDCTVYQEKPWDLPRMHGI